MMGAKSCLTVGYSGKCLLLLAGVACAIREQGHEDMDLEFNSNELGGEDLSLEFALGARDGDLWDELVRVLGNGMPKDNLFTSFKDALDKLTGEGAEKARAFVEQFPDDVEKALKHFQPDGSYANGLLPASAFNDYYKWTMMPVMRRVHDTTPVVCTFSVNVRDKDYRQRLVEAATSDPQGDLFTGLVDNLQSLRQRPFDRERFKTMIYENKLPGFDDEYLDFIAGPEAAPRTLAQEVIVHPSGTIPEFTSPEQVPTDRVVIHVYVAHDNKLELPKRLYIEAIGPWPLVTWLETSLMQSVYDVLFRDQIKGKIMEKHTGNPPPQDSAWYPIWLAQAFVRTARSAAAVQETSLAGALFVGRRTGGLPLMMLEAMFLKHTLGPKFIGQSSVTAYAMLGEQKVNKDLIPKVAGTHAHELSMVMSAILGKEDDEAACPLSQTIGHTLYFYLSVPGGEAVAKNAMLPDTLGTENFMKTANQLHLPGNPSMRLLDTFGLARQDSGTLPEFKRKMEFYTCKAKMMASEIETADDLKDAEKSGFAFYGAGGFFGDSLKTWYVGEQSPSMAAKVLRVYMDGKRTRISPVKTGDSVGKLEVDSLLPPTADPSTIDSGRALSISELKDRVKTLQQSRPVAKKERAQMLPKEELQKLFEKTLARFGVGKGVLEDAAGEE